MLYIPEYDQSLSQLRLSTQHLATQAFRQSTSKNHAQQAAVYMHFRDHYKCHFINPSIFTVCMYITHFTRRIHASRSVRNYVSGIIILHRDLGLSPIAQDSFQVNTLLRASDISMRTPPLRCLPIQPSLLHCLCLLTSSLSPLGSSMWVCMTLN